MTRKGNPGLTSRPRINICGRSLFLNSQLLVSTRALGRPSSYLTLLTSQNSGSKLLARSPVSDRSACALHFPLKAAFTTLVGPIVQNIAGSLSRLAGD